MPRIVLPDEINYFSDYLAESLNKYLELAPGWDSCGAAPISVRSVNRCIAVVNMTLGNCKIQPHCVPISNGGIRLEWQTINTIFEMEVTEWQILVYLQRGSLEWEKAIEDHSEIIRLLDFALR